MVKKLNIGQSRLDAPIQLHQYSATQTPVGKAVVTVTQSPLANPLFLFNLLLVLNGIAALFLNVDLIATLIGGNAVVAKQIAAGASLIAGAINIVIVTFFNKKLVSVGNSQPNYQA